MSNLAYKFEPMTAIESTLECLSRQGYKILSREELKREEFLRRNQPTPLKRCEDGHKKEVIPMSQTVVCLDCDPWFEVPCGVCGTVRWGCAC